MMIFMSTLAEIEAAAERLTVAEQEELLSHLAVKLGIGNNEEFPVRDDHVRLLDQRFAAYRDDPRQASTWEDVKRRFEANRA
jgi:putative addiction module component (TIGR02574 family)